MPRGSALGERRGGRKKGTPDKATAARQAAMQAAVADCFATMSAAEIEALTPKEIMLRAMHAAAKNGDTLLAVNIAERAAPYYNSRLTKADLTNRDLTLEELVLRSLPVSGKDRPAALTVNRSTHALPAPILQAAPDNPPSTAPPAKRFIVPPIRELPVSANLRRSAETAPT